MINTRRSNVPRTAAFSERATWRDVGSGWEPLFGSFRGLGCSIEWHDFRLAHEMDWGASFHPDCLELCLNISGEGYVEARGIRAEFAPATAGFYYRHRDEKLEARRAAHQQHQFLTVEFSCPFLARHFSGMESALHPAVCAAIKDRRCEQVSGATVRLTTGHRQLIETLRLPPVYAAAQPLWYQCKALELAVTFLTQPPPETELFCTRQQRLAQERVELVIFSPAAKFG